MLDCSALGLGAVNLDCCPSRDGRSGCKCKRCLVCNYPKHMAIHGPCLGAEAGSEPWGHPYQSAHLPEAGT